MTELLDRDTQLFPSLLAVKDWLEFKGYKISKSKIYRDRDEGKIDVEADGKSIKVISVWDYVEQHLGVVNTDKSELKRLQARKVEKTLELKEEQIARMRFNRKKEQGKFIPKEEVDLKVISVLTVMDVTVRQMMEVNMSDLCHLMTGDVKKVNAAKDFMDNIFDEAMNKLARTDSFSIKIEGL